MKIDFYSVKKMRSGKREDFIGCVVDNFPSSDVLSGELHFKIEGKRPDGSTFKEDKFLFLTPEEKKMAIVAVREKSKAKIAEILEEGETRHKNAFENELLKKLIYSYGDREIATIIAMSVEEPITQETFTKACDAMKKNKEIGGAFWKSYRFKGFIRWSQTKEMLAFHERNINPSEVIHVSEPVKTN